jgi:hypothetical protein
MTLKTALSSQQSARQEPKAKTKNQEHQRYQCFQWFGFPIAAMTAMTAITAIPPVPPLFAPCYELTPSGKKVHERPVESRFCMSGVSRRSRSPLFFSLLAGKRQEDRRDRFIAVIPPPTRENRACRGPRSSPSSEDQNPLPLRNTEVDQRQKTSEATLN